MEVSGDTFPYSVLLLDDGESQPIVEVGGKCFVDRRRVFLGREQVDFVNAFFVFELFCVFFRCQFLGVVRLVVREPFLDARLGYLLSSYAYNLEGHPLACVGVHSDVRSLIKHECRLVRRLFAAPMLLERLIVHVLSAFPLAIICESRDISALEFAQGVQEHQVKHAPVLAVALWGRFAVVHVQKVESVSELHLRFNTLYIKVPVDALVFLASP